jgi:RelA/SpoT family (p)ppGpp synthetase
MRNKRRSFEELNDIYGFRVIVENVDECYRALGVIHNTYKPIPGRFSDYVAIPKENGYQSLHTVVFGPFGDNVEVQIRTHEMNRIAEGGVAAHWIYKSEGETEITSRQLSRQWMLELLDPARQTGNPREFLEHLKTDLFPDEVYVFTPRGDIKKMPMGATALDFAYAVHTDVGMHSAGARVNRELASLPTVLNNGDTVEIITSKSAHPTAIWLNYAITGRARSAIHHYLKNQRREDALKLGKRLLGRALKTRRFGRKTIPVEMRDHLLDQLGIESWDDLLIDIGFGNRLPDMVARQMLPPSRSQADSRAGDDALLIRGAEGMLVNYARCCRPIPGDSLIGSFTTGHGLVVHTADCPNTVELRKQPDKCLMVEWHAKTKKEFPVRLRVTTENRRGVFGTVATAIAEQESNINQVEVDEGDGRIYNLRFVIEVRDRVHLAKVIRGIRTLDFVTRVVREKG